MPRFAAETSSIQVNRLRAARSARSTINQFETSSIVRSLMKTASMIELKYQAWLMVIKPTRNPELMVRENRRGEERASEISFECMLETNDLLPPGATGGWIFHSHLKTRRGVSTPGNAYPWISACEKRSKSNPGKPARWV